MITSKTELREYINADNSWCKYNGIRGFFYGAIMKEPQAQITRYLKYMRVVEYYHNTAGKNFVKRFLKAYYQRKKNCIGCRLGIEINLNSLGKGVNIYHIGDITVDALIGENCSLHGGNCIGNNGITKDIPILGDNVDIGYGAIIIGGIQIANNVKIGANAVVNKSFMEPGCTIAGIPAIKVE